MSNATPETDGGQGAATGSDRQPRWVRAVVAVSALLVAALFGATAGLFLAGTSDSDPSPSAVDVGFAQDMARHHRQGVIMARIALQNTDDPAIGQLAFDIASTQNEQMGRMHGWLALWGKPVKPVGERMAWMPSSMHGGDHGQHSGGQHSGGQHSGKRLMPGMATNAELDRLRSLSGKKLNVYFLQLMIRHHQGGAPMARYAAEHADIAAVRNLAEKMLAAQTAEVTTMKRMLADRGAESLPAPYHG